MKKLKIYLDTTVISYLDQPERGEQYADSHRLWEKIKAGMFDVYLSEVTTAEVNDCKEPKKSILFGYLDQM